VIDATSSVSVVYHCSGERLRGRLIGPSSGTMNLSESSPKRTDSHISINGRGLALGGICVAERTRVVVSWRKKVNDDRQVSTHEQRKGEEAGRGS
jgi:hypothetical protein